MNSACVPDMIDKYFAVNVSDDVESLKVTQSVGVPQMALALAGFWVGYILLKIYVEPGIPEFGLARLIFALIPFSFLVYAPWVVWKIGKVLKGHPQALGNTRMKLGSVQAFHFQQVARMFFPQDYFSMRSPNVHAYFKDLPLAKEPLETFHYGHSFGGKILGRTYVFGALTAGVIRVRTSSDGGVTKDRVTLVQGHWIVCDPDLPVDSQQVLHQKIQVFRTADAQILFRPLDWPRREADIGTTVAGWREDMQEFGREIMVLQKMKAVLGERTGE